MRTEWTPEQVAGTEEEALRRFLIIERLRGLADLIERNPDDAVVGAHIRELHGISTLRAAADRI